MTYLVEVRYTGSDWADLMADMRSWLNRRQIDTEEFNYSSLGRGITFRVGFRGENQAAAFAEAFGGRLQSANPRGAAEQWRMPHSPGGEADPSITTLSPKRSALSDLDDPPPEGVQLPSKASQARVSLMITQQQKADLRERGYSDEQIRDMKPEEAHKVLGLID
jgi:hypothetical protein